MREASNFQSVIGHLIVTNSSRDFLQFYVETPQIKTHSNNPASGKLATLGLYRDISCADIEYMLHVLWPLACVCDI